MAIEVILVNDTIEFIQQETILFIILSVSTLALVVITLAGIMWSNLNTRKSNAELKESNKITERMLELTHRPIPELKYIIVNWKFINFDWFDPSQLYQFHPDRDSEQIENWMRLSLENHGIEPIQDITISYRFDFIDNIDPIDAETFENNFSKPMSHFNYHQTTNIDIPMNDDREFTNTDKIEFIKSKQCLLTLQIDYLFLGNTQGYLRYVYLHHSENSGEILYRKFSS